MIIILRNLIDNLHLCQYPQVKRRMRRDAQPDSDTNADEYEDEDEGTNLCSAFEISQHLYVMLMVLYYRCVDQYLKRNRNFYTDVSDHLL